MAKHSPKTSRSARSFLSIGPADRVRVYHHPTTRLFVQPSLFDGFGALLDFAGANFPRYNFNISPAEADRRAILADFRAVYSDFAVATQQFEAMTKATA